MSKVSDAQVKLFDECQREYERKLEGIAIEFQNKVIELAESEVNHQPLFDQLAQLANWDCFPNDCTIALVSETGETFVIARKLLNTVFNLDKPK